MGRYQDARLYYREVLRQDSTQTHALYSLATIESQVRNYHKADDHYRQLLQLDTSNAFYYKRAAFTSLRTDDILRAIDLFHQAYQLNRKDMEVVDQLSTIYLSLGQLGAAEKLLIEGLNQAPNNIHLLQNLARLKQKKAEHTEVISAIERTLALGDTTDYYQMMLGVAYLKIDSLDQGIQHLQAIVDRKADVEKTHYYLGLAFFYKKDFAQAEIHFLEAINRGISPKLGDYYEDLARVKLQQSDRPQAIQYYKKALDYKEDPETVYLLANQTDVYYRDKRIALRYYQQYLNSRDSTYRADAEKRVKHLKEVVHLQRK